MRHSAAHVLAKAVQQLYPGSKLGIGPVIENGFYYDIDIPSKLGEDDLPRIEERMRQIVAAHEPFTREEWSKQQALEHYSKDDDNPYKREIVEGLAEVEQISIYRTGGDWVDLCRGPHVEDASAIGSFKLLSVSGAYWRGDERRPTAAYLWHGLGKRREPEHYRGRSERKRDHHKLGRELGCSSSTKSPGQLFWLPKGLRIIRELEALLNRELDKRVT
jgi:threonyl-tRNA synthetase